MVDETLPFGPLRYLFLDLNAYFASVEQQERPELRGRPVAVVPVEADTSFCIAASYEAKAHGIKTGTQIGEAKATCPELVCVKARPQVYVAYHNRVVATVEKILPVDKVCSIDEMRIRLLGEERSVAEATRIAVRIKAALRAEVGECVRASIGLAPNAFLAKVATDMQKPDGLVVLSPDDLPHRLHALELTDFAGINRRMAIRLNAAGIFTAEQMCAASREKMIEAFGGIIGERWYYLLRGDDLSLDTDSRKSLGHSHVLPPDLRNDEGCRTVLLRLIQKASARLRSSGLWAKSMAIGVSGFSRSWSVRVRLEPTQDTVAMTAELNRLWTERSFEKPRSVSVTFTDLLEHEQVTPSLFDQDPVRDEFNRAVDAINGKFGKNAIHLAGLGGAKDAAPERIAFAKTELFAEGKGDHEWVDTFRGVREV
jgi:DNA polymerase-4